MPKFDKCMFTESGDFSIKIILTNRTQHFYKRGKGTNK